MNRKILVTILLFFSLHVFCQGQLGLKYSLKQNYIESNDFDNSNFRGHSIGISSLMFISNNSDLGIEFDYTFNSFTPKNYRDYYYNFISLPENIIIESFNIEGIYNYYLKIPNLNKFFYGLQAGLGLGLGEKWIYKQNLELFEGANKFKPYYTLGITAGTEKLRFNIRFNNYFNNYLSDIALFSIADSFNRTEKRFLNGKNSYFSLSLIYYFTNFEI